MERTRNSSLLLNLATLGFSPKQQKLRLKKKEGHYGLARN
jgi:hypothetical protein